VIFFANVFLVAVRQGEGWEESREGGWFLKKKGRPEGRPALCLAGFGHFFSRLVAPPLTAWRPRLQKIHPNILVPVHERNENPIHLEFLLHHRADECKI
jgi:hypothetical protein